MAFLHDLGLAISTWQAAGDNIILMADMNCDIWKKEISSFVANLGLQESILAAHPTLLPPITFKQATGNRNHLLMESGCPLLFMPLLSPFAPFP